MPKGALTPLEMRLNRPASFSFLTTVANPGIYLSELPSVERETVNWGSITLGAHLLKEPEKELFVAVDVLPWLPRLLLCFPIRYWTDDSLLATGKIYMR